MTNASKNGRNPKAPAHLSEATKRWWRSVIRDYALEEHHVRLLTLAAESWDRCVQAREAIANDGAYIRDRFGCLKVHPAVNVERDSKILFARLIRELDLDVEPPATIGRPITDNEPTPGTLFCMSDSSLARGAYLIAPLYY